ncbi:unnamed protein product [Brassica napus]|uniref:(rape) hypothetical protein n=1 Tax=Brassica napus TaxID=3708 RepID=A0A816XZA3_BRANA|nr:unnamed protein product [Brassica napus]
MDGSICGLGDPFLLLFSNPYHEIFEVVLLAFHLVTCKPSFSDQLSPKPSEMLYSPSPLVSSPPPEKSRKIGPLPSLPLQWLSPAPKTLWRLPIRG